MASGLPTISHTLPTLTYTLYVFSFGVDRWGLILRDLVLILHRGFDWSTVGVFMVFVYSLRI